MTLAEAGKKLGITPEAVIYRIKTGKVKAHKVAGYRGNQRWNVTSLGNGSKNVSTKQVAPSNGTQPRDALLVLMGRGVPSLLPGQIVEVADFLLSKQQ